jgi:hypothetical protein
VSTIAINSNFFKGIRINSFISAGFLGGQLLDGHHFKPAFFNAVYFGKDLKRLVIPRLLC